MPAFTSNKTVTIRDASWGNWESVVIKEKMSLADEEWVSNQYARMGTDKKGSPSFQASIGSIKRKTLERMIVSWTFAEDGKALPVTSENIARLSKEYADYIYEQINERNQPMTAEEQEDFLPSANPATSEPSETN